MASRIIHLAITDCVSKTYACKDKNRLRLGCVLPDAARNGNSHMKILICNGTKKTYDLTGFRMAFLEKMLEDDLYLGYYLHLVQDILFRRFVYGRYHWNPRPEGNAEKLHNDYSLINRYVIEKYGVLNNLTIPPSLETEPICKENYIDAHQFLDDLKADFNSTPVGKIFFFTREMADEFIEYAIEKCRHEIYALFHESEYIDEIALAWEKM